MFPLKTSTAVDDEETIERLSNDDKCACRQEGNVYYSLMDYNKRACSFVCKCFSYLASNDYRV